MIQEYQYEIIAFIVALTAIIIYFLSRQPEQKEEETVPDDDKLVTEIAEEIKTIHEPEDEIQTLDTASQIKPRPKIDVPPHGKITRESFTDFAGVKILVAEDNMINQKVINGLLKDSGIEITMADDGQIALDILEKNSDYNMILMDAHMPNIDGYEATRIIRANPNYDHIVVVALSGETASDDVRKMIEAGMEEQLEKPLKIDALYDVIYAYTKSDTVVATNELNIDKGLSVCGGDAEFYKDILNEFLQSYTDSTEKIQSFIKDEKIELADALLLDLVGVAANIGADNTQKIALDLKESLKNLQEKNYIEPLKNYEIHLQVLIKEIKEYI